jgi:hypothetical protein
MRKCFLHFRFALPPRNIRRNELIDIRRHAEMRDRIPGRHDPEQNGGHDHRRGMPGAKIDRADNGRSDNFHACGD